VKLASPSEWTDLFTYSLSAGEPVGLPTGWNPACPLYPYRSRLIGYKARERKGYAWTFSNSPGNTRTVPGGTPAAQLPNYYNSTSPPLLLASPRVAFVTQHYYGIGDNVARNDSFGVYNGNDGPNLRFPNVAGSLASVPASILRVPYKLIGSLRVHGADIAVTDANSDVVAGAPSVLCFGGLFPTNRQAWVIDGCDKVVPVTLKWSWHRHGPYSSSSELAGKLSIEVPAGSVIYTGDSGSTVWALDDAGVLHCVGVLDSAQPLAMSESVLSTWNSLGTVPQLQMSEPTLNRRAIGVPLDAPSSNVSGPIIHGYNLTPGWVPSYPASGSLGETLFAWPDGRSFQGFLLGGTTPAFIEPQKFSAVRRISSAASPIEILPTDFPCVDVAVSGQPVWLKDAPVGSLQKVRNSSGSSVDVRTRGASSDESVRDLAAGEVCDFLRVSGTTGGGNPNWVVSASSQASGGGGLGSISSVFGRTGAVLAESGDYSAAQVTANPPTGDPSAVTVQSFLAWLEGFKLSSSKSIFVASPLTANGVSSTIVEISALASLGINSSLLSLAQSQVTNLVSDLAAKAPLASPALTGNPTAPNQAAGTNSTRIANTAYVDSAIAALTASAPGLLDTLDEIAAALGDDPNFATTITTLISGKLAKDQNLGDLPDVVEARQNLDLGTSATLDVAAAGDAAAGEVVKGNDSRLTNSRAPTAHASSHAAAGGDPLTLDQSQITGLTADLAAKAAAAHTHPVADLQAGSAIAGDVLIFNGTEWVAGRRSSLWRRRFEFETDFTGLPSEWLVAASGGSFSTTALSPGNGRVGMMRLTSGGAATNRAGAGPGNLESMTFSGGEVGLEWSLIPTTWAAASDSGTFRVGLLDSVSGQPVDGAYFEVGITLGVSTNWRAVCRSNGVQTLVDSLVAFATGSNIDFAIVANAAGTSVEFFINGASVATIATNIPAASNRTFSYGISIIKSAGTTNFAIDNDRMRVWKDFTTPR
jgi:hypothetical protein